MDLHGQSIVERLAGEHLGAHAGTLLAQRLPSVRLRRGDAVAADGTGSRFGGQALLPPGTPWPERNGHPLSFLGQVRVDDVQLARQLPVAAGSLLAFFYDLVDEPWGFSPADAGGCRVVLVNPDTARAVEPPAGAGRFEPHGLSAVADLTFPDLSEPAVQRLMTVDEDDEMAYLDALDEHATDDPVHRMFGWPDLVQNPMQMECQLAANGIDIGDPKGLRDPRVAALEAGADDWRLLLQVDSDDEVGWMWGDAGRLYFWILEQDLAAGRLDNVWLVLQCG